MSDIRNARQLSGSNFNVIFGATLEHHAGRLRGAQIGYRTVLRAEPDPAPALHYFGLLAHQVEQYDLAMSLLRQAVAADGTMALSFHTLGKGYRAIGRPETPSQAIVYRMSSIWLALIAGPAMNSRKSTFH
jgi:tetratricopeptide (TPR) repeat protein